MMKYKGFTLIEILIALSIFSILAVITSSSLYHAFNMRTRTQGQAARLNELQLTWSMLNTSITQAVARPVRAADMQLVPAFVGTKYYFELTRDGHANPQSLEKRSTLKRVAFVCEHDSLKYQTWESLDAPDRNHYTSKEILGHLRDCEFNYLNQSNQFLGQWDNALTQNQQKEPLPKAIQVNLTLEDWGVVHFLFIIPGALYGLQEIH